MIISIMGYSQINVHNVVPSYATPYFQANIRVKDSLQSQNIITDSLAIMQGKVIMQNPNDTMLSVRGNAFISDTTYINVLKTPNFYILQDTTDYTVIDDAGFEYLRHNYGDSSTTISNLTISSAATDTAVVIDGNLKADTIFANIDKGYKIYTAMLNQYGSNDPSPIVFENEIGLSFIRTQAGEYISNITFQDSTTYYTYNPRYSTSTNYFNMFIDNDEYDGTYKLIIQTFQSGSLIDQKLFGAIEIRVYP
jgi:hypothetical protein